MHPITSACSSSSPTVYQGVPIKRDDTSHSKIWNILKAAAYILIFSYSPASLPVLSIRILHLIFTASPYPGSSVGKESTCKAGDPGLISWVGREKEMATHSSIILAWEISWAEEPGRLQSMGLHRVGDDLATKPPPHSEQIHTHTHTHTHTHLSVCLIVPKHEMDLGSPSIVNRNKMST